MHRHRLRRREFITQLGGARGGAAFAARAQQAGSGKSFTDVVVALH
jgi:hypothetical protein